LCCVPPFEKAHETDKRFCYLVEGKMEALLSHWQMLDYVPADAKSLLNSIFRYEKDRIFIDEVINHKYIQHGFVPEETK